MAKKNRGKSNNRSNNTSAQKSVKTTESQPVTKETVVDSATAAEFEQNKEKFIAAFLDDLETLEKNKSELEDSIEKTNEMLTELKTEEDNLKKERDELQALLDDIQEEYEKASSTIVTAREEAESILCKAKEEADATREAAQSEKLKIIVEAADKAKGAYKSEAEKLEKQLKEIADREIAINDAKRALEKDRREFDEEKAELEEFNEYVMSLRDRYQACNPAKVEHLQLMLKDEQSKYQTLLEKYNSNKNKLFEAQVLLDTIKGEIEDKNGNKHISSLSEIVSEMHELRRKYEDIVAIYDRYPDNNSIVALEEKALKADKLERENSALEQERNRYREEVVAAKNASKEFEIIKREVEATNALNEHLLQELESHKTALESRTGDTCPSLSKVDIEVDDPAFVEKINRMTKNGPINSLDDLVEHIKNYAGSRRKEEQLFYTSNDIRAFISGMAVSRLIILQGMSGTGKSSLPRIISDAISGFNRLIPVESSWRDRNELLGYYNDFNKKFNAKSFTIELYRSAKKQCQDIPTFIVLDEMNLARIEYYFSDFLAILQEPDHDKWLIELVSSDMRTLPMELPEQVKKTMKAEAPTTYAIWQKIERSRQGDLKSETSDDEKEQLTAYLAKIGKLTGAKDLIDGRKMKITDNIWFVGTANQDESTFEISDKVYDRAQVVSLNRKGKNEGNYRAVERRSVSVDDLQAMFEDAITYFEGTDEVISRLIKLDDVLVEHFDVSFGNRIVTQTVDFAAVFEAAGGDINTALDYQISSKILRKVLSSDDAEAFLELLDATGDYPETQRLINKRLKELG